MSWLIIVLIVMLLAGVAYYMYQMYLTRIADYAESVRVRIKAEGGQNVSVDKVDTPHLSGAFLFAVNYTDADGRQIMNRVTVHTTGEYKFKQFWGEPVTPV